MNVLARDQDGPLVPDFMLEPIDGAFADVLDLKLPSVRLLAGRKDRVRFSAQVAEALSQVREYRAYFEGIPATPRRAGEVWAPGVPADGRGPYWKRSRARAR